MTQFAMGGGMDSYTVDAIQKALFAPPIGKIASAREYSDADLDWADRRNLTQKRTYSPCHGWEWHNVHNQVIEGPLWGGCLEVLDFHLSVKRFLPSPDALKGAILFLETSEEMPSEGFVYRFLAALAELGFLQRFQAILMGYPKAQFCGRQPPEGRDLFIAAQRQAVKNALKDYKIELPVIFNMNFGHTDPQTILPSGGHVRINGKAKTVELL